MNETRPALAQTQADGMKVLAMSLFFLSASPAVARVSSLVQRVAALRAVMALLLAFAGAGMATAAQLDPLEIATRHGVVVLEVEMARTEQQRTTGLMFRKELPERQGMLFDFGTDQVVHMWMKNTYIPLDMLFIRANGTIARIEAMTTPFSERVISSGEPVRAVLEIPGGAARRLGIAAGDQVSTTLLGSR